MTFEEWVIFISFTIIINVITQTIAWKIGYRLGTKSADKVDKRGGRE